MTIYAGYGKMWPPEAITELNDANLAARLQAQRGDRLEAEIKRLRAALRRSIKFIQLGNHPNADDLLEQIEAALATEEDFAIAKTRMNEPDGLTHEELKKKYGKALPTSRAEGEG